MRYLPASTPATLCAYDIRGVLEILRPIVARWRSEIQWDDAHLSEAEWIDLWLIECLESFEFVSFAASRESPPPPAMVHAFLNSAESIPAIRHLYKTVRFPLSVAGACAVLYRRNATLWISCYFPTHWSPLVV